MSSKKFYLLLTKLMTDYKKISLAVILIITLMISGGILFHIIFVKGLREQITAELRQEIKKIVEIELKEYARSAKGASADGQGYAQDAGHNNNAGIAPLTKQDLTQDLSPKIRKLVKDELDSSVAGQGDSASSNIGGLRMKPKASGAQAAAAKDKEIKKGSPKGKAKVTEIDKGADISAGKIKDKALERTLVEKGGMLLKKGQLQIEPSFTTAHFSSNRINIQGFSILPILVIGQISTESVKRDIFIEGLSMKYGIWKNLQGEVKVPFRYEFDRVTDNLGVESTRSAAGMGDVELALSRQIGYEKGIIPDLVFLLSTKTTTGKSPYNRSIGLGTGHWAVKGALIAAKSSDPVLVFGSLSYTRNFERNIENYGVMKPGDTIGYSLGSAIALSYQAAINFQLEQSITSKMRKNGDAVNGSYLNAASLRYGLDWVISENFSVDFSVSHGLTSDAPDYVIELRFPITF